MRGWKTMAVLAALAAWMPAAARALILTTWTFPSNVEAIEEENAANTNVVTVLELGRSGDGETVSLLYKSATGKLSALAMGEDEFAAKFQVVKAAAGRGAGARAMTVAASDSPDNYSDKTVSWLSVDGGEGGDDDGWGSKWKVVGGTAEPTAGFTSKGGITAFSLMTESTSGETVVGRDLDAPVENGAFSINAWLDAAKQDFRGFAVYENGQELLRWGGRGGFVYSLDGGETEVLFFDGVLAQADGVEYSLTWQQMGNDLQFTLSESTGQWEENALEPLTFTLGHAASVTTIALIVTGTPESAENPEIAFNRVEVWRGSAVPEPGTLGLLAAGMALLGARRGKRR